MSLENLQTLSKLSPNSKKYACTIFLQEKYACTIFLQEKYACSQSIKKGKKVCARIFFFWVRREFGESLEILQTHFVFVFFAKKKSEKMKIDIKQTLPCELGVSLEILQTLSKVLSKLGPNSYVFKSLFSFFLFVFFLRGGKREWARRFSKLSPNWLQTHMRAKRFSLLFLEQECVWSDLETLQTQLNLEHQRKNNKYFVFVVKSWNVQMFPCDFGVSLDILQTLSKPIPNSSVSRNFKKDKRAVLARGLRPTFLFQEGEEAQL